MNYLSILVIVVCSLLLFGCSKNDCPLPWHDHDHGNNHSHVHQNDGNGTDEDDTPEEDSDSQDKWSSCLVVTKKLNDNKEIGKLRFKQDENGFTVTFTNTLEDRIVIVNLVTSYKVDGKEFTKPVRKEFYPNEETTLYNLDGVQVDENSGVLKNTNRELILPLPYNV